MDKITFLRRVVGVKQTGKAIANGTAVRVYLACDADPALTAPLADLCREKSIPVCTDRTMQTIGHESGISVGSAAAAEVG